MNCINNLFTNLIKQSKGGIIVVKQNKYKDSQMIDSTDAQHPSRKKAIQILETIAEKVGDESMFDQNWYELEDMITNIIEEK